MWEYLFLLCMVLLAVVLTFPKKSQIRRVITTTPMLLRNIIKTRSVKNGLRPFIGDGGCHNKGGSCCGNKVSEKYRRNGKRRKIRKKYFDVIDKYPPPKKNSCNTEKFKHWLVQSRSDRNLETYLVKAIFYSQYHWQISGIRLIKVVFHCNLTPTLGSSRG